MCITSMQFASIVANNPDSNEEEYYGCSDIAIRNSRTLSSLSTPIHHTKTNGGFTKQITTIVQTTTPQNRPPSPRQPDLVTESVIRCRAIAVIWKGIPTFYLSYIVAIILLVNETSVHEVNHRPAANHGERLPRKKY